MSRYALTAIDGRGPSMDGDFLLIYILPESYSHQIAEDARNGVGKAPALMAKFSEIAEDFDFILRKTIP